MTENTSGVIPGFTAIFDTLSAPALWGSPWVSPWPGCPSSSCLIVAYGHRRAAAAGVVIGVGVLGAVLLLVTKAAGPLDLWENDAENRATT